MVCPGCCSGHTEFGRVYQFGQCWANQSDTSLKTQLPNPHIIPRWAGASAPDPVSFSLHRSASIQGIFHATTTGIKLQRGLSHKFYYSTQVFKTPTSSAMPTMAYKPVFLFSGCQFLACRFERRRSSVCKCVFYPTNWMWTLVCKVLYVHKDRGFPSLSCLDLHLFCFGLLHSHWTWLPFIPLSLCLTLFVLLPRTTTQQSLLPCFPLGEALIPLFFPSLWPLIVSPSLPPYLPCPPSPPFSLLLTLFRKLRSMLSRHSSHRTKRMLDIALSLLLCISIFHFFHFISALNIIILVWFQWMKAAVSQRGQRGFHNVWSSEDRICCCALWSQLFWPWCN